MELDRLEAGARECFRSGEPLPVYPRFPFADEWQGEVSERREIGRASCRERV